jgi:hypothetical protein
LFILKIDVIAAAPRLFLFRVNPCALSVHENKIHQKYGLKDSQDGNKRDNFDHLTLLYLNIIEFA